MKIDHLVVNIDSAWQEDPHHVEEIRSAGLPYMPKWGKGTRGFKVSNVWIGKEYLELVRIKRPDGGGWIPEWTQRYLAGHRGLVGLAIDVEDIEAVYRKLRDAKVKVTRPEPLRFKWFFRLLTRTMPWKNAYLPPFEGMPFQLFLQQMDNEKARSFMEAYMVPNSRNQGIEGIAELIVYGRLTADDKRIVMALFDHVDEIAGEIRIAIGEQIIRFVPADAHRVEVVLRGTNREYNGQRLALHNLELIHPE
ncbi:VOC family protein [Gorillibacterium sp. CAU 1737]|uniref:VOC family protein n=1 Tax=Gorillibacterium sp. CAU 1737 TaxID=3140362 RepID=UPI0032614B84